MDEFGTLDIHKDREMAEAGLPYKEKVRQLLQASVAPATRLSSSATPSASAAC